MENPFESGHIKNYLLLYASVVVIMVLFFIATTLFHDKEILEQKIFNTTITKEHSKKTEEKKDFGIKLIEKPY